jgi:hypothetical protein
MKKRSMNTGTIPFSPSFYWEGPDLVTPFKPVAKKRLSDMNLICKVVNDNYVIEFEEQDGDRIRIHTVSFHSEAERDQQFAKLVHKYQLFNKE